MRFRLYMVQISIIGISLSVKSLRYTGRFLTQAQLLRADLSTMHRLKPWPSMPWVELYGT